MSTIKRILTGIAAGALTISVGCASHGISSELQRAREAYSQAASGPAGKYAKDELIYARKTLEQAELENREDAGSAKERHLARLAERRVELAMVEASTAQANEAIAESEREYARIEAERRRQKEAALDRTRLQLESTEVENEALETQADAQRSMAEAERQMRAAREEEEEDEEEAEGRP